ncbi:MAG TPA: glucokinase [Usitatibacter sp.]|nr:glucokinase [Usitatibacter sp.]
MILAGDVGGTKILLEVGEMRRRRWEPVFERRYPADGVVHFEDVMQRFLGEFREAHPGRAIEAGAIGVAGPRIGNTIKMTNRPWAVDGGLISERCGIPRFKVVNDLAASAAGVECLGTEDLVTLQPGEADPAEPRVVMGVGTGLGVAYLVPDGRATKVVPGEAGHVGFAPETPEQAELWRTLFTALGRVEVEDVVSGRGLANVYEFMARRSNGGIGLQSPTDPAWITGSALTEADPVCAAALDLFAECLGNVAGNHALSVMARGGVFLAGGVVAKIARALHTPRFRQAFCAKGAFSTHLMRIPVHAVLTEKLPVIGAARTALEE